jgi:1,4-dihydroxy-2-naphthoate octaprenyltransferase
MAAKGSKKGKRAGGAKQSAPAPQRPANEPGPGHPGRHSPEALRAHSRGKLSLFLRAAGLPFWPASILPVLIGTTLPFWLRPEGFAFSWLRFVEALVGVLLLHAGADLTNEYFDYLADSKNPRRGGLAGGSGALPDGLLSPGFVLRALIICYVAAAAIGIHLNMMLPGNTVLIIGALGLLGGFFYTAPPLRLSYRGLGEVALGPCFGVLPVLGAYYAQAGELGWRVVMAGLPSTFAVALILWVNEIVDYEPDREAGKRNLVVRIGTQAAGRGGVIVLATLVFASLFVAVFTASLIPLSLVAILAFGLARTIVVDCWQHHDRPDELGEAQVSALKLNLTFGIIIAASALVAMGA